MRWSDRKPEFVEQRTDAALARLGQSEQEILSRSREEFLGDREARDLASFHLFLSVQACIDVSAHRIAREGWPVPDDPALAIRFVTEQAGIQPATDLPLQRMVRLWEQIGMDYATVDHGRMYDEYREGIAALRRFLDGVRAEAGL
jgi:uncharacterized protein YutE (UPF0331/DUF86 family)